MHRGKNVFAFSKNIKLTGANQTRDTKKDATSHVTTWLFLNIRIITGIGGKGMTSSAGYAEESIRQWS
ncbi:hypothetical protein GCM10028817_38250 [Spirosoma pomorum]|jgi:hypothetical protein